MTGSENFDAIVVGGGLAGLTAAAYLARGGKRTLLLDGAESPGGRASTVDLDGHLLNVGPHALYRNGPAYEVLSDLGVEFTGGRPPATGLAELAGAHHTLPAGLLSMLGTSLFGWRAKVQMIGLLGRLGSMKPDSLAGTTAREWIHGVVSNPDARAFALALVRLATYVDDPDRLSAQVACMQLKSAVRHGVLYVDGGWHTLVAGLRSAAEGAGAEIRSSAGVVSVSPLVGGWSATLKSGETEQARAVLLAVGSAGRAQSLLDESAPDLLDGREAVAVRAACLDIALESLPHPDRSFVLGVDRPLYGSVHSAAARLAPPGGVVLHVAQYLGPREPDREADEAACTSFLDRWQPGWQDRVVHRRFLPDVEVVHDLATAGLGGLAGRPGPQVAGAPGLYVAGDWVGPTGWLAEASFASGRDAAGLVARAS